MKFYGNTASSKIDPWTLPGCILSLSYSWKWFLMLKKWALHMCKCGHRGERIVEHMWCGDNHWPGFGIPCHYLIASFENSHINGVLDRSWIDLFFLRKSPCFGGCGSRRSYLWEQCCSSCPCISNVVAKAVGLRRHILLVTSGICFIPLVLQVFGALYIRCLKFDLWACAIKDETIILSLSLPMMGFSVQ